MQDVGPKRFELLSAVRDAEVIASGRGVRVRRDLRRRFGGMRWRKMKGNAVVRDAAGNIYEAEIHWYEAHGVGRVDWKIKGPVR
jgi:hypothetical protein